LEGVIDVLPEKDLALVEADRN